MIAVDWLASEKVVLLEYKNVIKGGNGGHAFKSFWNLEIDDFSSLLLTFGLKFMII